MPDTETILWPEDRDSYVTTDSGPNYQLAIYLLAGGATHGYVAKSAGFDSVRAASAFARDDETRRAVLELSQERAKQVGKKALVRLQQILDEPQTDLRATVLAVRTALEVSGELKSNALPPSKTVRELTVPELNELIHATRNELNARVTRQRAGNGLRTVERVS